jgi:hypothetical protein
MALASNQPKETVVGKEAMWNDLHPALVRAWDGWNLMHGFDAGWEALDRALFDQQPRLYRHYQSGPTPAMLHGGDLAALASLAESHARKWGKTLARRDLEHCLQPKG